MSLEKDNDNLGLTRRVVKRLAKVDAAKYWAHFLLKFPERVVTGIFSGAFVYILLRLLGL